MSDKQLIFDAMIEMRACALEHGRTPRRWEINEAGITAVRMDERFIHTQASTTESWIGRKMLGIPMANLPSHRHDDDPKVDLVVDEIKLRR